MSAIDIRQFDMNTVQPHRVWLIIGGRNTGKTVLLEDILYHVHHLIDLPCIMCPTLPTREMMAQHVPPSLIHSSYDYDVANTFFKLAETMRAKSKKRHLALVIDDCVYDKKIMQTETQRALHLNGRHLNTSLFVTTQYCMTAPAIIRGNIDYVVALKEPNRNIRKKLYEYFFGIFPTYKMFENVFNRLTSNYGCVIFDRTQSSNTINDCIKYYRAQYPVPPYKIGKHIYFKFDQHIKSKQQH